MLLASLSKARQDLPSKRPLKSVSVLFTPEVFLETVLGAARPPETEVGRGERRSPLGGGLSLCDTSMSPPCCLWRHGLASQVAVRG